jgi:hypothetical protein
MHPTSSKLRTFAFHDTPVPRVSWAERAAGQVFWYIVIEKLLLLTLSNLRETAHSVATLTRSFGAQEKGCRLFLRGDIVFWVLQSS